MVLQHHGVGHCRQRVVFTYRHTNIRHGKNRVIAMRNGFHPVLWYQAPLSMSIASILTERAFGHHLVGYNLTLEDYFSMGWHQHVTGLTLNQLHWCLVQCPGVVNLTLPRPEHGGSNYGTHRVSTNSQGKRHGLALRGILSVKDSPLVLSCHEKHRQMVPVVNHGPVDTPVSPVALRVFGNDDMPAADVPATITIVDQRCRETEKVDIVATDYVLFARAITDHLRFYRVLDSMLIFPDELPDRRLRGKPHGYSHPS